MTLSDDAYSKSWAHAWCPNCFAEGPHVLVGASHLYGYEVFEALHAAKERAWELWDESAGGAQVEAKPPSRDAMQLELGFEEDCGC